MQVAGDLDGLEQALGRKNPSEMFGSGSCSALLKLLPGNKDLLISHDTWGSYNSMLRLFKFYNLPFHRQQGTGMNRRNSGEVGERGSWTIRSRTNLFLYSRPSSVAPTTKFWPPWKSPFSHFFLPTFCSLLCRAPSSPTLLHNMSISSPFGSGSIKVGWGGGGGGGREDNYHSITQWPTIWKRAIWLAAEAPPIDQ